LKQEGFRQQVPGFFIARVASRSGAIRMPSGGC
jgi:hypothetical protein